MTKKHFQAIAESIAKIQDMNERKRQAEFQAELCKAANPRFDEKRFFAACGIE